MTLDKWLITPGQCLLCGGRGGYPGAGQTTQLCTRCDGTGRDPARATNWYIDHILPEQIAAQDARDNPMRGIGL